METAQKLKQLRKEMQKKGISAAIIPSGDTHLSEYVAEHWRTRAWLSGFTGSAGTVVITENKAGLWTDSRYFLQAERELEGSGIELFKMGIAGTPAIEEWLLNTLPKKAEIGVDARLFSVNQLESMKQKLLSKKLSLKHIADLGTKGWDNRPRLPKDPIYLHDEEVAGKSISEKIADLQKEMEAAGATVTILSALDEIAWLFNLRGSDVAFNPVFYAYAVIYLDRVLLFVEGSKLPPVVTRKLKVAEIHIFEYEELSHVVKNFSKKERVLIDPARTSHATAGMIPEDCKIIRQLSPVTMAKACKTEAELAGIRDAMVNDGLALVEALHWIETTAASNTLTELSVGEKFRDCRAKQPGFMGESFESIVGYGEHGAIVHYSATPETSSKIKPKGFLLIDSGGQYRNGTTDITRTIHLSKPNEEEMVDYTLVLRGMIGLAMAVFPRNTRGSNLDMLARQPLLSHHLNYGHGTGHGVGFFLNVHEGPQSIRLEENSVTIQPGMVCSDEPGVYRAGKHGIRIENLIACVPSETNDFGSFLKWETVTLCPIDLKPVKKEMLSKAELDWLNAYHQKVYDALSPRLVPELKEWLAEKTKAI